MFPNHQLDGREYQKELLMETLVDNIRITHVLTPRTKLMNLHGGLPDLEEDMKLKPLKYSIEKIAAQIDYLTSKFILETVKIT